jgi:hypothetical protein
MACAGHGVGHTGQLRGVDLHELRRSCLTGPASSVGRDDIEGLFGHDVTGPGPAGPSGSALGLGKLAFGSGRGGTHTAMSTNYDLDIVGRSVGRQGIFHSQPTTCTPSPTCRVL